VCELGTVTISSRQRGSTAWDFDALQGTRSENKVPAEGAGGDTDRVKAGSGQKKDLGVSRVLNLFLTTAV
jgi:hypothetical protein